MLPVQMTSSAPAKSILPATWTVPEDIVARLGESAGRQRPMLSGGHLLLVLHEPPGPDDTQRVGRFFWRDVKGSWKSNNLGPGIQALRKHVAEFMERIEKLDDEFQAAATADDYFRILQEVTPLFRTIRHLHATLQEARELMPQDRELISVRDLAGTAERAAELLQTDSRHGLDFTIARSAEEESRRTYQMALSAHRLNVLAAIFLPLATISTVLGMNLRHGWENTGPEAFWIAVAIGAFAGLLLTMIVANRPAPPLEVGAREKRTKRRRQ
ncbi:MAG: hypothetical protein WD894_27065 [Pirellulales bacterium]